MGTLRPDVAVIILGEFERRLHLHISKGPRPVRVIKIVDPVLEKPPNRLRRGLADQARIDVTTSDISKTANLGSYLAERIWALPCHCPRADPTRTRAADRS